MKMLLPLILASGGQVTTELDDGSNGRVCLRVRNLADPLRLPVFAQQ